MDLFWYDRVQVRYFQDACICHLCLCAGKSRICIGSFVNSCSECSSGGSKVRVLEITQSFFNKCETTHTSYTSVINKRVSLKQGRETEAVLPGSPEVVTLIRSS